MDKNKVLFDSIFESTQKIKEERIRLEENLKDFTVFDVQEEITLGELTEKVFANLQFFLHASVKKSPGFLLLEMGAEKAYPIGISTGIGFKRKYIYGSYDCFHKIESITDKEIRITKKDYEHKRTGYIALDMGKLREAFLEIKDYHKFREFLEKVKQILGISEINYKDEVEKTFGKITVTIHYDLKEASISLENNNDSRESSRKTLLNPEYKDAEIERISWVTKIKENYNEIVNFTEETKRNIEKVKERFLSFNKELEETNKPLKIFQKLKEG